MDFWIALRESMIRLAMTRCRGFYFLRKQNEAKTFARIRTSCGFIFFGLPRFGQRPNLAMTMKLDLPESTHDSPTLSLRL